MSYLVVGPDLIAVAARELAGIGSAVSAANAAAVSATTVMAPAAADEVSAAITALFSEHGQQYQAISAHAAGFHQRFVHVLNAGAGSYLAAEVANAESNLLGAINAPAMALFGRPIIGDGANATTPGGAGGDGATNHGTAATKTIAATTTGAAATATNHGTAATKTIAATTARAAATATSAAATTARAAATTARAAATTARREASG
ncbi:PE-PGRS family protein PE_PGRS16 [Mycobacterium simulans]|uniref:PE family protein n=1 Tax=Mycobacterium simulans TaxID=627089 RepID=UPI00174CA230|nr:PE family protein [Mycobacterium simulans]SON61812.1 PE-PGRS family protein PE_PGRS16 [Mycobacterium simulans]